MGAPERAVARVPGLAPKAPKRNLLILLLYLLGIGIGLAEIGVQYPDVELF